MVVDLSSVRAVVAVLVQMALAIGVLAEPVEEQVAAALAVEEQFAEESAVGDSELEGQAALGKEQLRCESNSGQ